VGGVSFKKEIVRNRYVVGGMSDMYAKNVVVNGVSYE